LPNDNEGLLGGPYTSADYIEIIAQTFVFDHVTGYVDNIAE
jgi:hypothetical protein